MALKGAKVNVACSLAPRTHDFLDSIFGKSKFSRKHVSRRSAIFSERCHSIYIVELGVDLLAFGIGASSHAHSNCLGERMKALGKIHVTVWLLGLAGAALFTILLIRQGLPQVGAAFAAAGWAIAAVVAFHFAVPVFLDALAWWVLFPKAERPALRQLLWMRWVGESVRTLVPSAAVGGDIVRARLAAINGTPLPLAAGSVLADITLGVFVQIAFTLLGLGLIVSVTGHRTFV